jgi:hypothetical protein
MNVVGGGQHRGRGDGGRFLQRDTKEAHGQKAVH